MAKGEPFTPFWLAIAIPGTRMFGVIDFFASDEKREQHLGGKIAEALFANAERLLAGAPDVAKVDVVAWKVDGLSRPEPKKQCCYSAYR